MYTFVYVYICIYIIFKAAIIMLEIGIYVVGSTQ